MRSLRRVWLVAALVLFGPAVAAQGPFVFADTPGTLPKDVVPLEYALHLTPDIAARSFRATGRYRIEVLRPTPRLVLHAHEIEIASATLRGAGARAISLGAPEVDAARQTVAFTLPAPLRRGRYSLELAWRGRISASVEGLYADAYPSSCGPRVLLATEMQPVGARRLLPSWDEPSFRARFRLTVDLPPGFAGFSNMPVARRDALPGGGQRLAFATTPPMASYLLALVAGELERVTTTVGGTELGVVVTAGKTGRAQYALDAGAQLLAWYGDYFATRYPLPKLDQIGVPGGFGGAMENWGAIVYTEAVLLVDPRGSPERTRQIVYGTVAHEIAHQWLGNLVTMAWWDDLWLNEAFADWMAMKASERFHPEWRVALQAIEGRELAMDLDARATTHPMRQPVATESEAERAFDRITYEKGGAFVRMLEAWLGEAPFRDGLRAYLAKHAYANTTGADVWRALAAASGEPVEALAADWTTQPGFPLVSVDARCEAGRRVVSLRQERFEIVASGGAAPPGLWRIPLSLDSSDGGAPIRSLLQAAEEARVVSGCAGALVVDAANVGFYRVRYAPALFDELLAAWPRLPDAARLKLLADTGALVRADQAPLAQWLAVVARLGDEPRLAVWTRVVRELEGFARLLGDDVPARQALDRFAVRLIAPRFAALGADEKPADTAEERQLRGLLLGALAHHGDATAIADSRARFARFLADGTSLSRDLVGPVLKGVGEHADAATWEQLRGLAAAAPTGEERFRALRAMGEARDPALAARNLQLALAPEVPRLMREEMVGIVAASGHLSTAWSFARQHAATLLADTTQNGGGRYFGGVVDSAASATLADELEAYVAATLPPAALVDARRAGDEIRTRARIKARLAPQLAAALAASS
jgi:aminopeptidase N